MDYQIKSQHKGHTYRRSIVISRKFESLLRQSSRIKWFQERDDNSKFFHSTINWRRRSNGVKGLWKDYSWLDDLKYVKKEINNFFQQKFKEHGDVDMNLDGVHFKSIGDAENEQLTCPFSDEEVKSVVWDCEGKQSSNPYGYKFSFIKAFWHILKEDICFALR